MKWPWVSRATYDDLQRICDRLIAQTTDAIRMAERSHEITSAVLDKLEAILKPRGNEESGSSRNPLPMAVPERNDLTEAIELASGTDKGLARHLTRWAKQQQLDGMKERDIIHSILHWPRATEWDGEPGDVPEPLW